MDDVGMGEASRRVVVLPWCLDTLVSRIPENRLTMRTYLVVALTADFLALAKIPPMAAPKTIAMKASTQRDNKIHQKGIPQKRVFRFSFHDFSLQLLFSDGVRSESVEFICCISL